MRFSWHHPWILQSCIKVSLIWSNQIFNLTLANILHLQVWCMVMVWYNTTQTDTHIATCSDNVEQSKLCSGVLCMQCSWCCISISPTCNQQNFHILLRLMIKNQIHNLVYPIFYLWGGQMYLNVLELSCLIVEFLVSSDLEDPLWLTLG